MTIHSYWVDVQHRLEDVEGVAACCTMLLEGRTESWVSLSPRRKGRVGQESGQATWRMLLDGVGRVGWAVVTMGNSRRCSHCGLDVDSTISGGLVLGLDGRTALDDIAASIVAAIRHGCKR